MDVYEMTSTFYPPPPSSTCANGCLHAEWNHYTIIFKTIKYKYIATLPHRHTRFPTATKQSTSSVFPERTRHRRSICPSAWRLLPCLFPNSKRKTRQYNNYSFKTWIEAGLRRHGRPYTWPTAPKSLAVQAAGDRNHQESADRSWGLPGPFLAWWGPPPVGGLVGRVRLPLALRSFLSMRLGSKKNEWDFRRNVEKIGTTFNYLRMNKNITVFRELP